MRTLSLGLLISFFAVLVSINITPTHGWGGDFAGYIMQAECILQRNCETFVKNNSLMFPTTGVIGAPDLYPWGFPMILYVFIQLFGRNYLILKSINIFFSVLFLVTLYSLFKPKIGHKNTLLGILLVGFNIHFWMLHNNVSSDIPYLFFSALILLMLDKLYISKDKWFLDKIGPKIMLGILLTFTVMLRTAGLTLVFTYLILELVDMKTRKKPLAWLEHAIPLGVFILLYLLYKLSLPSGTISYYSMFKPITLQIFVANAINYGHTLGMVFVDRSVFSILLVFFFIGFVTKGLENLHLTIYLTITIIMLFMWPMGTYLRLLLPTIFIFVYFSIFGALVSFEYFNNIQKPALSYITNILKYMLLIVPVASIIVLLIENPKIAGGPYTRESTELFNYVRDNIDINSSIVFIKPRPLYMLTGRKGVFPPQIKHISNSDYYISIYTDDYFPNVDQYLSGIGIGTTKEFENEDFVVYKVGH